MRKLKVHRQYRNFRNEAECGSYIDNRTTIRDNWRGVTCKNCLRVKAAKEKKK